MAMLLLSLNESYRKAEGRRPQQHVIRWSAFISMPSRFHFVWAFWAFAHNYISLQYKVLPRTGDSLRATNWDVVGILCFISWLRTS
jgi:hypothetical protein